MNPIDKFLPTLSNVKRTGPITWIACCPAHEDRHPSLNVKVRDDGAILVICRVGCAVGDVVGAVGLEVGDLFPQAERRPGAGNAPERRPWLPRDVFEIARREVGVAAVIACDVHAGKTVSDADHARLLQAASTLDRIAEASYDR